MVTVWSVFNIFFLIGSLPLNLVYIGIFLTVQLAFTLVSAAYFLAADGHTVTAGNVKIAAGAFAFASGMLGYYTVGNLMCQEAMGFSFPMGDTSRFFRRNRQRLERAASAKESVLDDQVAEAGAGVGKGGASESSTS
nr:acetate transporter protein pata [Quercus suber]